MRIVVLDSDPAFGSTQEDGTVLGQIADDALQRWGEVEVHALTPPELVVERCREADVVLTNKVPLGAPQFEALPRLSLVSVLATGVNVIDTEAAAEQGVTVCNVPGYSTASTAQHALALLLELCHHVGSHERDVRAGGWVQSKTFSYFRSPLIELHGRTMGIVGLGAIGRQMAVLAHALGMRVIAHTRTPRSIEGVELVDKETLLRQSDVISLHCPLTEQTKHFIDDEALGQVRSNALLINVARGPVVDEKAVASALKSGKIAGFATDVLSTEPPQAENPLLGAPRAIITPHIAWATQAARQRLIEISAKNIEAFLAGRPENVVALPKHPRRPA